jgi:hypothetical protein
MIENIEKFPKAINKTETIGDQLSKGVKILGKEAIIQLVKVGLSTGVSLVSGKIT